MTDQIEFVLLKNKKETPITLDVHIDDTIDNIKNKLSRVLDKDINHYYLFYKKRKVINPYDIYNKLSLNNTKPIDNQMFVSFCMNHNIKPEEKDDYDIDDFLKLNLSEVEVNEPIGIENKSFIVNPFDNIFNYYENVQSASTSLLMNYNARKIYVCLAEDVYPYLESSGLELEHTINVYFPYLFSEKKFKLDSGKFVDKYLKYDEMIEFHHKIFDSELATKQMGVSSINLVIYTKQSFIFPSEIFFRLLQSTNDIPLIKLNPGKKQENIYRIFSPKMSDNGNKVPLLKKKRILKIMNTCKKENTLYYIIDHIHKEKTIHVIIEINREGHIYVTLDDLELFNFRDIEQIIKETTDLILVKLSEYFDPSNKIFNTFETLIDESVEIIDLKFKYVFKRQSKLELDKYIKCFSSIFNFVENRERTRLRYKRVSNFNELDSMDAFLVDLINQQQTRDYIINALSRDYNISMEDATQKFDGVLAMYRANEEMNRSTNRIFRIKNNPGFPIDIYKKERTIEVEISNINNVYYIEFLSIFINNLILISQNVIRDDSIQKYCGVRDIKVIDIEYEIEAPIEFTEDVLNFRIEPGKNIGEETEDDLLRRLEELEEEDEENSKDKEKPELELDLEFPEESASPEAVSVSKSDEEDEEEEEEAEAEEAEVEEEEEEEEEAEEEEAEEEESPSPEPVSVSASSNSNKGKSPSPEPVSVSASSNSNKGKSVSAESVSVSDSDEDASPDVVSVSASNEEREEEDEEKIESPSPVSVSPNFKNPLFIANPKGYNRNNREAKSFSPKPTSENSHERLDGGSGQSERKYIFFYDHHNKKDLIKLIKRDIPWIAAEIKDHFRCMVKTYCTLVEKEYTTCRGAMTSLSNEELSKIEMFGFTLEEMVIYDKEGNRFKGYTFINEENTFELPNVEYIRDVYLAIKTVWKDIDGGKKLYIYDNNYEIIGVYDGAQYIDKEDERVADVGHSNPFLKRLQEKEPTLFLKDDDAQYSQYSRICAWNQRRQPVILTKEEKDEIDAEAPGTYDSAVEYGTDPANKFYYICPKYWNLRTNKPMLEKDVDPSKVIDQKLSKAKSMKDKYIFQFSTDAHGHYPLPGFLDNKSHPKGHFIPCCFKMKENPSVIKEYKEFLKSMDKAQLIKEIKKEKIKKGKTLIAEEDLKGLSENSLKNILIENKMIPAFLLKRKDAAEKLMAQERAEEKTEVNKYIQDGLKFPLDKQRIGFLTLTLEKFFKVSLNDYYDNIKTKKFKINKALLFRYGIEQNKNTSFLYAIGSILVNIGIIKGNPLDAIIDYIGRKVTLDNIHQFHNGKLPQIFSDETDVSQRVEKGYSNFMKYIRDKTKYVDYRYLWDIICGLLFKTQVNMIILYEPLEDSTHNLSIICPTTYHSRFKYDVNKPSIILYKKGEYFEPLFYAKKIKTKKLTTIEPSEYVFLFDVKESFIAKILKSINTNLGCKEINVSKKYKFKQNKSLEEIQKALPPEYSVMFQVIGFDFVVIGAIIKGKIEFFIPCRPGAMIPEIDIIRIDDVKWNTYDETVGSLIELYKKSNKQIFCQPSIRVLEDTMIVGVLTITNQFVQLNEPEPDQYDGKDRYGLDKIEESNYIENDKIIAEGTLSDYKDKMIHKLKLEKKFYNAYFNILKIEINKFKNIAIRQRIEEIIKNAQAYSAKIEQIKDLLNPIIERKIDFITYSDAVLVELEDINLCKESETEYCTPDGVLLVPKMNLYTNQKNDELYLIKFIDGILRNHNVKLSVFEQSHSTIYFTDKYNLTDNEILMLESLLMPYLDRLGQTIYSNDRVTYLSFEDLQPEEILNLADIVEVDYESPELLSANESEDSEEEEEAEEEAEVEEEGEEEDEVEEEGEEEDEVEEEAEEEEEEAEEAEVEEEVDEEEAEEEAEEEGDEAEEEVDEEEEAEEEVDEEEVDEEEEAEEEVDEEEAEEDSSVDSGNERKVDLSFKPKIVFKKPKEPSPEEEFDLSFEPKKPKPKIVFKKPKEPSPEEEFDLSFEPKKPKPTIVFKKPKEPSPEEEFDLSFEPEKPTKKIVFKNPGIPKNVPLNVSPEQITAFKSKDMLKCIDRGIDTPDYPTEKWKKLLPKKTKRFRIRLSDDFSCNFLLLIYILKDFDKKYKNYKISNIKKMLISSYGRLIRRKEMILSKWMNEEKQEFAKKIKKKTATFESIILSPNYFITTIDIVLLIHFYKIPIVLLYQQKGKVTTLSMENEKDYHYFMKVKSKNQFFLHYIDDKLLRTLKFNEDELSQPMLREINPIRLSEYFENNRL
jgi:chemotaxis protein histidine kinase CheA